MNKLSDKLFDLTGQVAIVTGTSRGLGQYLARALANAGADLVLTSRKRETLAEFAAEIEALGRRVLALDLDVRDEESIRRMAADAEAAFGQIAILVNNAGCNIRKPALEVTWDNWNQILETNLRGTFFVAQAVARGMIAHGYGRIVNIGSVTSVFGYAGLVEGLVARMRREMEGDPKLILTGGLAPLMAGLISGVHATDERLTLVGLRLIHELNAG